MLFNSTLFIFGFLPVVLVVMFVLAARAPAFVPAWLTLASIVFYAGWSVAYLPLLIGSVTFNYLVGRTIGRNVAAGRGRSARRWLIAGIAANLALLAYYKYAVFIGEIVHDTTSFDLGLGAIVLPVGISFFTFTQIAFLVDAERGLTAEYDPVRYSLFVTYYPHLVAGPILHHKEMIDQFNQPRAFRLNGKDFAAGVTLFAIGLGKKLLLADTIAPVANGVFGIAHPEALTFAEAWVGTLAYCMQIYFDFSGYSDMALGLGLMMGVRLPLNFNSPYKATNIIEFWRCWHMSLSRFLRDYLYIPLGGNRQGPVRRYVNLMITMALGGLWHGASWTFIVWGCLHGLYLVINHAWRLIWPGPGTAMTRLGAWFVMFIAVNVAWVFFRAPSLASALDIVWAMAGGHGITVPAAVASLMRKVGFDVAGGKSFANALFEPIQAMALLGMLGVFALAFPNSQTIMARFRPAIENVTDSAGRLTWSPSKGWALATGVLVAICFARLGGDSPFLYFRF